MGTGDESDDSCRADCGDELSWPTFPFGYGLGMLLAGATQDQLPVRCVVHSPACSMNISVQPVLPNYLHPHHHPPNMQFLNAKAVAVLCTCSCPSLHLKHKTHGVFHPHMPLLCAVACAAFGLCIIRGSNLHSSRHFPCLTFASASMGPSMQLTPGAGCRYWAAALLAKSCHWKAWASVCGPAHPGEGQQAQSKNWASLLGELRIHPGT